MTAEQQGKEGKRPRGRSIMAPEDRITRDSAIGSKAFPPRPIRRVLSVPYPPNLPTFEWLHVDPDGNIWAGQRRYGIGGGQTMI